MNLCGATLEIVLLSSEGGVMYTFVSKTFCNEELLSVHPRSVIYTECHSIPGCVWLLPEWDGS